MSKDILNKIIIRGVRSLVNTSAFSKWFKEQGANDGDIAVINNSFIYRKPLIKTRKNPQYLCLRVKDKNVVPSSVLVGSLPEGMNSAFKVFSAKSGNLPSVEPLNDALQREINQLGKLVFILIGKLESAPAAVSIRHSYTKQLRFDSSMKSRAMLENAHDGARAIVVNELKDPESAWNFIRPQLEQEIGPDLSKIKSAFAEAFEKLRDEARWRLVLPSQSASRTDMTLINRMQESVLEQYRLYKSALEQCVKSDPMADRHLREAMRIAYNFADDAIKVLKLLVSIADLKGVLLWCTIKEQYDIAEAFNNLPWTENHRKPSLKSYRDIISGARNHAFHNLLAFERTIEADLSGVQLNARRLTILPPYSRHKSAVPLDYQDREMVDVLAELTRAPEVPVSLDFWRKNAVVMEAFAKLLKSMEDALWKIYGTTNDVI